MVSSGKLARVSYPYTALPAFIEPPVGGAFTSVASVSVHANLYGGAIGLAVGALVDIWVELLSLSIVKCSVFLFISPSVSFSNDLKTSCVAT